MKLISFCLLMLASVPVSAQEKENNAPPKQRRLLLGMNASRDFCFGINSTQTNYNVFDGRRPYEKAFKGYSVGIGAAYSISEHLSINTGFQYSLKGSLSKDMPTRTANDPEAKYTKGTVTERFYYFDIPVKVNYTFGTGKLRMISGAGITANILNKSSLELKLNQPSDLKVFHGPQFAGYNKTNFSLTLSLGAEYELANRINIRLEPNAQTSLRSASKYVSGGGMYLRSYGVNLGVFYKI